MAYGDGTLNLSGNLNVAIGKPLDARYTIEHEADLTSSSTWTASGANYAYEGIIVYCKDTHKTKQLQGSNDYSEAANWVEVGSTHNAMPSDRFDNITWKENGLENKYTAPDDGYIYAARKASAANQYLVCIVYSKTDVELYTSVCFVPSANSLARVFLPISKGFAYAFSWSATTEDVNKFIYANGAY